jgi:hypothetical protein
MIFGNFLLQTLEKIKQEFKYNFWQLSATNFGKRKAII